MIRIDEIYCNIFLPFLQQKPLHGLHWFDPFGSVKFNDMCNVPPVDDLHQAVRFLFWDQEPLHKHTVDQTLTKFVDMFKRGKRHIITSEYDSTMVQYVQDTYGFISHYYFFHGWAALDWFRGYNRSFLIKSPDQRKITKTFLMPNRVIAGQRQHRLLMFYHIVKSGMIDNHISFPATCPVENITVADAIKSFESVYPDIQSVLSGQQLPLQFAGEQHHPMDSYQLNLFDQSAESLIYLVTETVATQHRQHLTEKTFKPICLQMPFVTVGTAGNLEYLRRYGFRTFGHLWDESYDEEINDLRRYERISWVLKVLDSCSKKEKQHIFDSARDVCRHNYEHFYGGGFERILWQELRSMLKEF